ncbi:MAG TPA: class I SAM-dependent DNA methyltransferase, partial [candidate division Zixibacteria bacterium]|nr:class I SAM-dependent DNA methyltransferase [candidate division Zixibacteria bacterium]
MNEKQAKKLIVDTLEAPFDKGKFAGFVTELLNEVEPASFNYSGNYIPDKFKDYISSYSRIGKYHDNSKRIEVLTVHLKKTTSLERARTMQRNFVAGYLAGKYGSDNYKDAALVAFVSPETDDWRFSLVKLDFGYDAEKSKIQEEFTPAKRWSFLVGENEGSHTAQSQLYPLILNDRTNPSLDDIEQAFNIETVTKEFFLKYRGLFMRTKEELDKVVKKNPAVRNEFVNKEIDTVDFAKKLLGQIVFLYFLQKKGWFGVPKDGKWGEGSRQYLRELFESKHIKYKNYFNDILEPLFYDAIAIDHSHSGHWNEHFKSRIPFLNGGLFDAIGGYSWHMTDIELPNSLFSNNNITPEGDRGDGILDIFDRYNFTVNEDLPMEKEVAIDPEMLGKIFEKLGAITPDKYDEWAEAVKSGNKTKELQANKKLGVYYTPREIVHYMCQQSLINYLDTELNNSPGTYERIGDPKLDMLGNKAQKGQLKIETECTGKAVPRKDIETLIQEGEYLAEHEEEVAKREKETKRYSHIIPESIRNNADRIDRALAEIKICDPAVGSGAFPIGMMHEIVKLRTLLTPYLPKDDDRTTYNLKRECIEKSLYGVDIDRGAVEIAKLRFWLSMVVDEISFENIKPLPNLDYKLVCGNSLLGIERSVLNDQLFQKLEALKPQFFNETNKTKKDALKAQIDGLIDEITDGKEIFDFEVYFSEVFHEKKGFDVVIANPPYVQLHKMSNSEKNDLKKVLYETYRSTGDIYCLFYEKGFQLLNKRGVLTFITSNKWMRADYGSNTRDFFVRRTKPELIIDFAGVKVFEATVDTNILILRKDGKCKEVSACRLGNDFRLGDNIAEYFARNKVTIAPKGDEAWVVAGAEEMAIRRKIERLGTPLKDWDISINYGIKTGYNEAFIIDNEKRDELVAKDPKSAEIIKPLLRGRDIKKFRADWKGLWLINSHNGIKEKGIPPINVKKDYPAIYEHLKRYEPQLRKRQDQGDNWTNLRNCAYLEEFEKEKIIFPVINRKWRFDIFPKGLYVLAPSRFITFDNSKSLYYIKA